MTASRCPSSVTPVDTHVSEASSAGAHRWHITTRSVQNQREASTSQQQAAARRRDLQPGEGLVGVNTPRRNVAEHAEPAGSVRAFDQLMTAEEKERLVVTVLRQVAGGMPRLALLTAAASAPMLVVGC